MNLESKTFTIVCILLIVMIVTLRERKCVVTSEQEFRSEHRIYAFAFFNYPKIPKKLIGHSYCYVMVN